MSAIGGTLGITAASIQGMDLETAMMAVQSSRANLLETQLKDQIASVQAKNDQVAKLNTVLGLLNGMVASFPKDATADTTKKFTDMQPMRDALSTAGLDPKNLLGSDFTLFSKVPKHKYDAAIATLKGNIDSLSNTQQMDMLRLQSLSNKRNEAFDLMSNFIKKMQDGRSSILGNMR